MKKYIIGAVWIVVGFINYAATLANFQKDFPHADYRRCREREGFAALWAFVFTPATMVVTPFVTGFYMDGFQLTCKNEGAK